jgi:hypothetical protein
MFQGLAVAELERKIIGSWSATTHFEARQKSTSHSACRASTSATLTYLMGKFYSCWIGVAKPKHGYFEHVLANLSSLKIRSCFSTASPRTWQLLPM